MPENVYTIFNTRCPSCTFTIFENAMYEHIVDISIRLTCPRQARPAATKKGPHYRPNLTHKTQILMVVDRLDQIPVCSVT